MFTPALITQLIAEVGLPLTQQLFALYHSGNAEVTPEQFALLTKLGQFRSSDALEAAGIKIVDGKVVPA